MTESPWTSAGDPMAKATIRTAHDVAAFRVFRLSQMVDISRTCLTLASGLIILPTGRLRALRGETRRTSQGTADEIEGQAMTAGEMVNRAPASSGQATAALTTARPTASLAQE